MRIGPYTIDPPLILAPMAGVSDKPYRNLCRRLGAGYAVSEMTTADPSLWQTAKSRRRMDHAGEMGPIGVQLAGADPDRLARAARLNVELGAQIIDINMGCPAKKVCKQWAGSALLRDERLVGRIVAGVVAAVEVPVTLKIRTGWDRNHRNGLRIARIAEDAGIAAIAVHGRTRDMLYRGEAEYETIAAIKQALRIPVMANGDIDGPEKARRVLEQTGADGLMIGRAAQGRPWIFSEIGVFLDSGRRAVLPDAAERAGIVLGHVGAMHEFYGPRDGVRIARKHIGWYLGRDSEVDCVRRAINATEDPHEQLRLLAAHFGASADCPGPALERVA